MTKREIVINALQHKETCPIPYNIFLTDQARDNLLAYTGWSKEEDLGTKMGNYICHHEYGGWCTELPGRPGYFKDDFGVVWNRTGEGGDIGIPDFNVIEDLEDYDYEFPVLDEARLRTELEAMMKIKENDDRFMTSGIGFSMFERSQSLMGMENVLCSMITCPEETEAFFAKICDYNCHILDIILEYDFDGIYFGDDWGCQRGLIMGYDHWQHYIKPQLRRMYKKVKDKGLFVIQHSCGDCHELFPDLIEIGLDVYQTFQPETYDIAKIKEEYGDKLSFWGGISVQQCLPKTTPEGVKKEAVRIFDTLHKNGGLIIAPIHAVEFDVPPENILALLEVFQNQEQYFFRK